MVKEFYINSIELGERVRAVLGVPENFLDDYTITSDNFLKSSSYYINKQIKEYVLEQSINEELLEIAYIYHIAYQLCLGMYARLPKQMENISTKTILQNIQWDQKAIELLDKANEYIDNFLDENGLGESFSSTFISLSEEKSYPSTTVV